MEVPKPLKKAPWEPSRIKAAAAPRMDLAPGSTAMRSLTVSSGYVPYMMIGVSSLSARQCNSHVPCAWFAMLHVGSAAQNANRSRSNSHALPELLHALCAACCVACCVAAWRQPQTHGHVRVRGVQQDCAVVMG